MEVRLNPQTGTSPTTLMSGSTCRYNSHRDDGESVDDENRDESFHDDNGHHYEDDDDDDVNLKCASLF